MATLSLARFGRRPKLRRTRRERVPFLWILLRDFDSRKQPVCVSCFAPRIFRDSNSRTEMCCVRGKLPGPGHSPANLEVCGGCIKLHSREQFSNSELRRTSELRECLSHSVIHTCSSLGICQVRARIYMENLVDPEDGLRLSHRERHAI